MVLELVPWLQKNDPKRPPPFDCDRHPTRLCGLDDDSRRRLHCGWMDASEWIGAKPAFDKPWIGDAQDASARVDVSDLPVCPGWAVRQAAPVEACQAWAAYDKGLLREYFPEQEACVLEAAMVLARAFNVHQIVQIRTT